MSKLLAALLMVPALVLPAAQPVSRTETRQEALAPGGKLWVRQVDGSLKVRGWDKPEVGIVAEFRDGSHGSQATLEVRRVQGGLELEVREPKAPRLMIFGWHRSASCDLVLQVPRKLSMYARTVDGSLSLEDLEGYADLHTVDGDIRVAAVKGEVHARTVDGAIEAHGLDARLSGGTIDGSVTLDRVAGGINLKTVDGNIIASGLDGWGEGILLATVDGSIHLKLGEATGNLDAASRDGRISAGVPGLQAQEVRKNHLRGLIPGRDQAIRLRTGDGDIVIE